jgi:hypothetical protein
MDKAVLYFFLFCIPLRIGLVILGWYFDKYNRDLERVYAYVLLLQITGFFLADLTERPTGTLGQPRWWYSSPHAYIFLVYVALALMDVPNAYIALAFDVAMGLTAQFARLYIIGRN